jgi:Flp pilus assembly protein TadG
MANQHKVKHSGPLGQSMAEFSLALPILLVALLGLLEVGRAVFMYASVVNASREAVRYATAFGVNESDVLQSHNCAEIRNTAKRVAFLLPLEDENITIEYDAGPDDAGVIQPLTGEPECAPDETVDETIELACGDRVVVTVTVNYEPIVPIVPMTAKPFTSTSARTFLGVIELVDPAAVCN